MMASLLSSAGFAPGHERVDIGSCPGTLADIGALLPRRIGRVGASLTLAGTLRALTLACSFPILSRQVESLDGLPQGGARLIAVKASAGHGPLYFHWAPARAGSRIDSAALAADCHGAGKAGGAP